MKSFFSTLTLCLALNTVLSACESGGGGGGGNNGGGGNSTAWANQGMQTLVANRCANAGCHDGTSSPLYKGISEANMKSDSKALSQVNAGLMPKGTPFSASELATFKNFYSK